MSDNINQTWLQFFLCFHRQNRSKRSRVDAKTPVFNLGMTYQSKQKGLTKVHIYCIWGGLTDIIAYARVVILLRLCLLEQCLDPVFWTLIKTRNLVTIYEFLIHVGTNHTTGSIRPLGYFGKFHYFIQPHDCSHILCAYNLFSPA